MGDGVDIDVSDVGRLGIRACSWDLRAFLLVMPDLEKGEMTIVSEDERRI